MNTVHSNRGYPVQLRRDGRFFLATFPDIPEAITQGETREEALSAAKDALATAMDFYFEERRPVPPPSAPKRGQRVVEIPASLSAKVLLLNEMIRQNIRPAELARRLSTTPQQVNRLRASVTVRESMLSRWPLKLSASNWTFVWSKAPPNPFSQLLCPDEEAL